MADFPTILNTSAYEIPILLHTWSLKRYPFRAEPPHIGHCREYSPRTSDRALLVTRALPCRLEKRNCLSQCLSPPRCIIAGDYNLFQGRGAIPNLSSSRCEALEIVTHHHSTYSKHTGNPRDYRFLLWKSELGASNSAARSAISSSLWRKIHSSPVLSFDICSTLI